jgi:hypothetical protein
MGLGSGANAAAFMRSLVIAADRVKSEGESSYGSRECRREYNPRREEERVRLENLKAKKEARDDVWVSMFFMLFLCCSVWGCLNGAESLRIHNEIRNEMRHDPFLFQPL